MARIFEYLYKQLVIAFKGNTFYARKKGVIIGDYCRIYVNDFGSEPFLIKIGNNVTVSFGVTFINHDGSTILCRDNKGRRYVYKKICIGDNVFIGARSMIMPGVRIGNNVIVGAGSIVTKSIPDNSIVAGNPAKYISSFDSYKFRVLNDCVSKSDLNMEGSYKERVLKVVTNKYNSSL